MRVGRLAPAMTTRLSDAEHAEQRLVDGCPVTMSSRHQPVLSGQVDLPKASDAGETGVRVVIFSRDRAMQLDATLTTFSKQCSEAEAIPIEILYAASSVAFGSQYEELERSWRGALRLRFHRERDFRADLLWLLGAGDRQRRDFLRRPSELLGILPKGGPSRRPPIAIPRYVLFLVDDNIFCRPFSIVSAAKVLDVRPQAIGFSLRLGRNTTYCYPLDSRQHVPQFASVSDGVFTFDWTTAEGDFGYPLEVSSSVYSGPRLANLVSRLRFSNPNTLEGRLAKCARQGWARLPRELLCFEDSVSFCNAVNKVQTAYDNRAGEKAELSPRELARRFDSGLRIDTRPFSVFTPNACHCNEPFAFVRIECRTRDSETDFVA